MFFLKEKSLLHEFAYTTLLENSSNLHSWAFLKEHLFAIHQGKHMSHNHRARLLACKQEKRSVYDYIQSLRRLSADVEKMDETTKVTILMEGLNVGPVRTQLFRCNPPSFTACRITFEEENFYKQSGSKKTPATVVGAIPMDVGSLEVNRSKICGVITAILKDIFHGIVVSHVAETTIIPRHQQSRFDCSQV